MLPVSGSTVCSLWQRMHSSTLARAPPCAERLEWQPLQAEVSAVSRRCVTGAPLGTKSSVASPKARASPMVRVPYTPMVWVRARSAPGTRVPNV